MYNTGGFISLPGVDYRKIIKGPFTEESGLRARIYGA